MSTSVFCFNPSSCWLVYIIPRPSGETITAAAVPQPQALGKKLTTSFTSEPMQTSYVKPETASFIQQTEKPLTVDFAAESKPEVEEERAVAQSDETVVNEENESAAPIKGQTPPPGWEESMQKSQGEISIPDEPTGGVPGDTLSEKFDFLEGYSREKLRAMVSSAYESELTTGSSGQPKKIFNSRTKSKQLVELLKAKVNTKDALDALFSVINSERTYPK